ncbi:MAG: hypothetical protein ACFE95_22580 [Candidatus Hodarchaeota archaeon]
MKNNSEKLHNLTEKIKKDTPYLEELEKSLDQEKANIIKRQAELEAIITITKNQINELTNQLKEYKGIVSRIDIAQDDYDFLKSSVGYFENRANQLKDLIRQNFNKKITDVYNILKYKDFVDIRVNPMFNLEIKRNYQGRMIDQPVESLSESEKVTLGILL